MAAPGIAAVFLWHAFGRPRLLWAVPPVLGLVLAAALARPDLLQRIDPTWLAVILDRTPHLLLSQWMPPDWARFFWGLCGGWLAVRFLQPSLRRLAYAVAIAGLAGVALSWLLVDLLGSAFAGGLKLWRAHPGPDS